MLFALSDTHLSFNSNKPMDKFGHIWHKHPEKIKHNCQKLISDDDVLILPGDLSWANKLQEAEQDLDFLASLPAEKILLAGNHDYWWATLGKMRKFAMEREWKNLHFLQKNAYLIFRHSTEQTFNERKSSQVIASDIYEKQLTMSEKEALYHAVWQEKAHNGDFNLIIGCKGYLLPPEYTVQHDEDLALREFNRLLYSYEQGLALLESLALPKHLVRLIAISHYPPLLKTYPQTRYTAFYNNLLAEFKQLDVLYGHLHGLGIKEALQGRINGVQYHLVSADAIDFKPLCLA